MVMGPSGITFTSTQPSLETLFQQAINGLHHNIRQVHHYDHPVLIEGAEYEGIWLESGPLSGLAYSVISPEIGRRNHDIFFARQHEDGYLPCWIRSAKTGTAQIQQVVPIAATALEFYQRHGDGPFLERAYLACTRWDAWLSRNRDSRKLNLCELFCEYDSGHDNSPRLAGLPHACPENNAAICPPIDTLPYLAPDLSATLFGGRVALSTMATILNKSQSEIQHWQDLAERTRGAILKYCHDPETGCFFDRDSKGQFVHVTGDALTRVLSEHVVDQPLAEEIFAAHIFNPNEFWTPYPLPSISASDPTFVKEIPRNSWGGATQALTALRAPRWFEHYGQYTQLREMMTRWLAALMRANGFYQQINPFTGEPTLQGSGGYSPAMLVGLEYITRLYGVRQTDDPAMIEWCCTPLPQGQTDFQLTLGHQKAGLRQSGGTAQLSFNDQYFAEVTGSCRVTTTREGKLIRIVGTSEQPQQVTWHEANHPKATVHLTGNQSAKL